MSDMLSLEWGLFILFAIHWLAFVSLSVRKATWRFVPAILTFTLLIALYGFKATGVGDEALYALLRGGAYVGLGTSFALWLVRKRLNAQKLNREAAQGNR